MESNLKPMIDIKGHPVFDYDAMDAPDRYVYHYTRWERLLDIAHTGLRLGPLARMNDPRESKDWNLGTVRRDHMPMIDLEVFAKVVAKYRERIRIAAFSLDHLYGNADYSGRRGYARPRMWAQYADNHRGVCIVMRRDGLDQAIRDRYPDRDGSWVRAAEVRYLETAPEDPATQVVEFLEEEYDIETNVRNHFARFADSMFFVKHMDWRDEKEYRWVRYDADESDTGSSDGDKAPFVSIKGHVAALVLGADYADAHLPVARMFALAQGLNGDVVRCQWDRLNLHLITFADGGDQWLPIRGGPYTMHLLVGKPTAKDA